jgi:type IVB pilus formation R64 PilN family outer membrane protein
MVSDDIWLGGQSTKLRKGVPLPKSLEAERSVALVSNAPLPLAAIVSQIALQTGLPVRLTDGADHPLAASGGTAGAGATQSTEGLPLSYEGPLSGLLDLISSHFGISWHYDGATIIFSRYETRTFVIESLPGSQSVSDGISGSSSTASSSGGSSGGGVSGTGTQTAKMDIDFKFWDELTKIVETILSGEGTYTLSPSTGTLTVITTPDKMAHIADFVSKENDRDSKQIALNVDVYSIAISKEDNYNLDPGIIFKAFGSSFPQLTLKAPTFVGAAAGAGSFAAAVTSGHFNGTSSLLSALSSLGNVSTVAHIPLTTLNNRPATREVVTNTSYLASETSTVTGTTGTAQTTLTPGTFQTGIVVEVTPRVLDDGRILLQYSLSISDQQSLATFAVGKEGDANFSEIQLPVLNNRLFVQQSLLTNGATLMLAGFDEDVVSAKTNGSAGASDNYVLGGGTDTTDTHQLLVIAITPHEIATPKGDNL